jgi:predicted PurR-regulated permease PerM
MTRLMMILFSMIATTLMGVMIIAALSAGYGTLRPIVMAAAIGFLLAIPVSYLVARRLTE